MRAPDSFQAQQFYIKRAMDYKRVLTIQDISCIGHCSGSVALPILSACGHETVLLPSAVLSTHTAFKNFPNIRDLTDDMPAINAHWVSEGLKFDAIYTGYLGSKKQIDIVKDIFKSSAAEGCRMVVDPAMGDHGKLYSGFDMDFVEEIKSLAAHADVIIPNLTEAALMTGCEYREEYDEAYILKLMEGLKALGSDNILITGVGYSSQETGAAIYDGEKLSYYIHGKLPRSYHGTGDIFASVFTGALLRGKSLAESAGLAAEFTCKCIENTLEDEAHSYGTKFEPVLGELIKALN